MYCHVDTVAISDDNPFLNTQCPGYDNFKLRNCLGFLSPDIVCLQL